MVLSPHRRSTTAQLLRIAAVWLACVLVLQGLAAAQVRAAGTLHWHRAAPAGAAAALFVHGHEHVHGSAERHHHATDDLSVLPAAPEDDGTDALALALAAALALLALGVTRPGNDARSHVRRPAGAWAATRGLPDLLFRPPRPR